MKDCLSLRGSCTPKRRLQRLRVFRCLLLAALTLFIRLNSVLVIWLFLAVGEKFFRLVHMYALKENPTEVNESTPFRPSLCRQQQPNRIQISGSLYYLCYIYHLLPGNVYYPEVGYDRDVG
jgi:hypothetical protein